MSSNWFHIAFLLLMLFGTAERALPCTESCNEAARSDKAPPVLCDSTHHDEHESHGGEATHHDCCCACPCHMSALISAETGALLLSMPVRLTPTLVEVPTTTAVDPPDHIPLA